MSDLKLKPASHLYISCPDLLDEMLDICVKRVLAGTNKYSLLTTSIMIMYFLRSFCLQDSNSAPFYKAEMYHQFHNGIGVPFSQDYTKTQKQVATRNKRIGPTGCPELGPFF